MLWRPRFNPGPHHQPRPAVSRPFADTRAMACLEYAMMAAAIAMLVAGATSRLGGDVLAISQRLLATCSVAHAASPLPAQRLKAAAD